MLSHIDLNYLLQFQYQEEIHYMKEAMGGREEGREGGMEGEEGRRIRGNRTRGGGIGLQHHY